MMCVSWNEINVCNLVVDILVETDQRKCVPLLCVCVCVRACTREIDEMSLSKDETMKLVQYLLRIRDFPKKYIINQENQSCRNGKRNQTIYHLKFPFELFVNLYIYQFHSVICVLPFSLFCSDSIIFCLCVVGLKLFIETKYVQNNPTKIQF